MTGCRSTCARNARRVTSYGCETGRAVVPLTADAGIGAAVEPENYPFPQIKLLVEKDNDNSFLNGCRKSASGLG